MAAATDSIAALLGRIPVVEELSPDDLLHVAEVAVPRSESHKSRLPRGRRLGHLLRGAKPAHARDARDRGGRVLTLATLGAGRIFGERKAITKHLRGSGRARDTAREVLV